MWGATLPLFQWQQVSNGFNPRTRVGCDYYVACGYANADVSIHAPVWGATIIDRFLSSRFKFQSTHPCGVRHAKRAEFLECIVSIHAPVWGATKKPIKSLTFKGFNPRTRVGCDSSDSFCFSYQGCFNPRTRVGCDRLSCN